VNLYNAIQTYDTEDYRQFLTGLPQQIENGYNTIVSENIKPKKNLTSIVISGMGGSAIGGELVQSLYSSKLSIPLIIVRDYTLPAFVGSQTLVIVSSYSGETEESLAVYNQAQKAHSTIVCITSGGSLKNFAKRDNIPIVNLPGKYQPRAAVGVSFIGIVRVLEQFQLIGFQSSDVAETVSTLRELKAQYDIKNVHHSEPYHVAQQLLEKIPLIYTGPAPFSALGTRWKCQFNENAKIPAFCNSLPEMNHNEIVGWNKAFSLTPHLYVVFLRDAGEPESIQHRIEITQKIIRSQNGNYTEVWSSGKSILSRVFSLLYFGDYTSYYAALLYKTNPTSIDNITYLKKQMKKFNL